MAAAVEGTDAFSAGLVCATTKAGMRKTQKIVTRKKSGFHPLRRTAWFKSVEGRNREMV
jgi:hypothetical protein